MSAPIIHPERLDDALPAGPMNAADTARRPLKSRQTRWAKSVAAWLASRRVSANSISIASVLFAVVSGTALVFSREAASLPRILLLVTAAAGIQLRLLCNLLDGMVAVEEGLRTKSGEVFNEVPDRIADLLILIGAGCATPLVGSKELGWLAALLALMTAYVRLLGGASGLPQNFSGPMAKPHRMAVLTAASLAEVALEFTGYQFLALVGALVLIVVGAALTAARRTLRIVRELESR